MVLRHVSGVGVLRCCVCRCWEHCLGCMHGSLAVLEQQLGGLHCIRQKRWSAPGHGLK